MHEKAVVKQAYRRRKRRLVLPWKLLTIFSLILTVLFTPLYFVLSTFDNTVAAFVGGTFWKLENEDPHAAYYKPDFATHEEMYAQGDYLCYLLEAEGAVLLTNNGALPLPAGARVSTLSSSSVDLVYGGTGSGNVDASEADDLKEALENSGLVVNPVLWDFYHSDEGAKYRRSSAEGESAVLAGQASIAEVPVAVYPDEARNSFARYGDAVIITISRVGGEGYDLEFQAYNYLALSAEEQEMLRWASEMKAAGTVKRVVVLINSSNALQVDFLKDERFSVDACLWIGGVGISGTNAVADILAGKVNPSGSLVDTYCYDNYSSPAMRNFVATTYEGYAESVIPDSAKSYMIYQEGIYVGYKYYETRYEDTVMGTGNPSNYVYTNDVAFPFGHGLSYTTFSYSDLSVIYDAGSDRYAVSVTITNTGSVPGKETVQVYFQSPYTQYDMDNGVEKASVALCGFNKTGVLSPGASETITVQVDRRDLACYDAYGAGTYILDAGDYYFTAATDAHNAVNNILSAKGYTTADGMDAGGDAALTWKWTQESPDSTTYATSLNGTRIVNQLSNADINLSHDLAEGTSITYLSRKDWTGTFPTQPLKLALTDKLIRQLQDVQYDPADYPITDMPTMGADHGMQLYDMIGKDFDHPDWDKLLDQLTFEEMVALIGDSFHWRMPAPSVNAPGARDENGPQGLTAAIFGAGLGDVEPTAFTSEDVMAATFNTPLMYAVGNMIGNNCLAADVVCLYGPGANTHRTPYGGRNFEYYSEDSFLAGEIGGAEVRGIQDKGVDVVMKHFALNDCEQDRLGQAVWLNEQTAREIYLKAFQKPLEESGGNGVMTAYTRWGPTWSGGHIGLMTGILRGEWGNRGMSITDNVLVNYCNGVDGIMSGGVTTFDAMLWYVNRQLPQYRHDPVVVSAMRQACHHNLYALANSSGMNGIGPDTVVRPTQPIVLTIVLILACAFAFFTLLGIVLWVWGARRLRRTDEYRAYRSFRT